ncbi:MAG: hypothetical protein M1832_001194 [Thelocarpon impressellum]|nr:MAG: hypothetical protein M1832_001194 [Thelocarpon impressellum]
MATLKRSSRVMAAVAAFGGGRSKDTSKTDEAKKMNEVDIEAAFEALLDSRNIPQNMRAKMRSLDQKIKADFIRQDKAESEAAGATRSKSANSQPQPSSKRSATTTSKTAAATPDAPENDEPGQSAKRARPRSKTFTFSKGDKHGESPSKKQKSSEGHAHGRSKSTTIAKSTSTRSLRSAFTSSAAPTAADPARPRSAGGPEEYVDYLRETQKPEEVEVGRVHKLRLVLRNERVAWVDAFITGGGMTEIVALLNRIMGLEWREEHEDALLHETLLCLKALCTTALALQRLQDIQSTLFPSLLGMLFDEEHKGPSEFSTRGIITSLLFMYLSAATPENRAPRARTLLSYLRDPCPDESVQPPRFITSMHQPRPYKVWCKEVVNVSKEVFWIFLHPLNTIALERPSSESYHDAHYPPVRPPVPAAPYVGGVEFEATNYMASHLDLLNGLLACLPTASERNALRYELKVSGFERLMGASLRTCKEKFYGAVHCALRSWVGAAHADGWDVRDVRVGPAADEKKAAAATQGKARGAKKEERKELELPLLELGNGVGRDGDGGWI